MHTQLKLLRKLLLLTLLFGWHSAQAQFAGDVFFANPSIAVSEGGQTTIEVVSFVGASTFGAAQLDLTFNPAELSIVSVEPGSTPEVEKGFSYKLQNGVLSIIALNGVSNTSPIGTVSLALITVAPLTAAGTIINVNSSVKTVLRQDSTPFVSRHGFGMELVVTNPLVATTQSAASVETSSLSTQDTVQDVNSEVYQRAIALRPEGSKVTVMVLDENNNATATPIQTKSLGVPTEE